MDGFCELVQQRTHDVLACAHRSEVGVWLACLAVLALLVWLLGHRLGGVIRLLWPVRATLMTVLAGAGILMIPAQGRELALGLPESAGRWWLPAAVLAWSFQAWLWSRLALYAAYGSDRTLWPHRRLIEILPRALAFAVHLLALLAMAQAGWRVWHWSGSWPSIISLAAVGLVILISGIALQMVLSLRHLWSRRIGTAHPGLDDLIQPRFVVRPGAPLREICAAQAPLGRVILAGAVLSGLWLIWYLGRMPVEAGERFGTAPILFLALGIWTAVGSLLSILSSQWRVPLLLCAILLGFGMNLTRYWHDVRMVPDVILPGGQAPTPAGRPTVAQALARWQADPPPEVDGLTPLVIVAAEGGGLRAAFLTATALGRAADHWPGSFAKAELALSAVSGGSLGALVHVASIAARQRGELAEGAMEAAARSLLSHDFLAAPTAVLLTGDTIGNVIPNIFKFGGRGTALENAWSSAWPPPPGHVAGNPWWNPLDSPFLSLWSGEIAGRRPQLLLNSTHQETGRRVIQSSLRIEDRIFHDAWDLHTLTGCDVWTSAVVHNSARFTYVSPAGALRAPYPAQDLERAIREPTDGRGCDSDPRDLERLGHLLDGGYFENYGAISALELAEAVEQQLSQPSSTGAGGAPAIAADRYRIVVILLSNDVGSPERAHVVRETACPGPDGELDFIPKFDRPAWYEAAWNEITAPFTGVLASRVARSSLAARMLARWGSCAAEQPGRPRRMFVHLAMCRPDLEAPLGWVMGKTSRDNIAKQLDDSCNAPDWARLDQAFGPRAPESGQAAVAR